MGLGTTELLIVLGGILVFFGGKRLPQLGEALGLGIKNFRKGLKSDDPEEDENCRECSPPKT